MVAIESDELLPFARTTVWRLLQDHMDDSQISRIHPLVRKQSTLSTTGDTTLVERTIDARGKLLRSQWKVIYRPPDVFRYDIVAGDGPYAVGSWLENSYAEEGAGTRIRTRGDLKVTVVPFFIPQRVVLRRVLDTIDAEDLNQLRARGSSRESP
jgi:hypothetical protein